MTALESTRRIKRGTAVTSTERILGEWADRAFLTLWSYPSVYRDQGVGAHGKEVCDLLVAFEDHIVIFSDKDIAYPDSGDEDVDWSRWFKRAIQKSANQIFGAERWIREHPDRLFLDRDCTQPFPIPLPHPARARVHRIVVAHDTTGRRRTLIGGSGSLMIKPDIVGDDHLLKRHGGGLPFAIGQVDPDRGYVHVLDDASLGLVLGTLDTVTDFVRYLERKEKLIESGRLAFAYGEEDLLAYYLKYVDHEGLHHFDLPDDGSKVLLEEGHFTNYLTRPEFVAKKMADGVSYVWDKIIEEFAGHLRHGTFYHTNDPAIQSQERMLRLLAREHRIRRRMLSRAITEKLKKTPPDALGVRVIQPSHPSEPFYVFLCVPEAWGGNHRDHREKRGKFLEAYCSIVMMKNPDAPYVVGIATESGFGRSGRSHDLLLCDREWWTEEDDKRARQLQEETGLFKNLRRRRGVEEEYPVERYFGTERKIGRNEPCPCGSGKKFKKCCWQG